MGVRVAENLIVSAWDMNQNKLVVKLCKLSKKTFTYHTAERTKRVPLLQLLM